jgi:flagellar operon protein
MIDALRRLPPVPGAADVQSVRPTTTTGAPHTGDTSFAEVLGSQFQPGQTLNFSRHAQSRLLSRQIQLTAPQMERLQAGVHQAAQKGARDSLVMVDNLAFIVSVANRTVVTAVDGANQNGNVFTQIDSAVIV